MTTPPPSQPSVLPDADVGVHEGVEVGVKAGGSAAQLGHDNDEGEEGQDPHQQEHEDLLPPAQSALLGTPAVPGEPERVSV